VAQGRRAGLPGAQVPEAYGGAAANFLYNAVIDEEVAASGCTGLGWGVHSDIAVPYIMNYGSDEQKRTLPARCVTGDIVMAIAMTEPGTGSDLQGIRTTAVGTATTT
jgi:alkylation response protein AidB-like acyl-CoA dehydrogenase